MGVAGPRDGSAKSALRLLDVRGWVLKTNIASLATSADELIPRVLAQVEAGARMRLWHPHKTWAVYRSDASWYALSATPELRTLRQVSGGMNRLARLCAEWTHGQLSPEEREWLVALALDAKGEG